MKNKKKKAFTLVELLAVIVILAVILVIAIPQIMNVIKAARLSSIKDSAMLIAEQAEKDFLSQQVLNKDYNSTSIPCSDVAKLNDDYDTCSITYNEGIAIVKLKGKEGGKFSGITCTGTKDNMNCKESDGTIAAANNEDAVEYLAELLDEETTSTTCDGTGKLIEVRHENGDVDYRYVGACPNNYVTFNGEAPTVSTVYQMYADGDISTNSPRVGYQGGSEYPDETTCINEGLNGRFTSLEYVSDIPAKCTLDIETNKYYIEAHGYLKSTATFPTQEICENSYSSQGMKSSDIPSGLSCRFKQVVIGGWRVIGIFDTQKELNGTKERRVKLVRNTSLGGNYAWDSSASTVAYGHGVNEWSQADLKNELNGDYLNSNLSSNTTWYNGQNNTKTAIFDKSKVLKASTQELLDNVVWHLSGSTTVETSVAEQYLVERNNQYVNNPSDGISRTNIWIGKVGLIYPSDYGYASEDLICKDNISGNRYSCRNKNWLFTGDNYWTITHRYGYPYGSNIETINSDGTYFFYGATSNGIGTYPSLYLKSDIKITGEGTVENPYTFSK